MMRIILYSKTKKNIEVILKALKNEGSFDLILEEPESSKLNDKDLKDIKIAIFDLTGQDINNRTLVRNIEKTIGKFSKADTGVLVILHPDQLKLLFENEMAADEFIFTSHLSKEILPRINFMLLKMRVIIPKDSLVVGDMILNLEKYELTIKGEVVVLTFKEFEMLKLLLENRNKVFTRINLLSIVWGYDFYGGSRTVDVHMRRLRAKIPPPYNNVLKTIRNVGYMFSPQD